MLAAYAVEEPSLSAAAAASSLEVLRSRTLPELVAREIVRLIRAGAFEAGARLSEAGLAERLGVSRSPVREAFRALEEAGLVRQEKNRGVFLRELSRAEVAELDVVREGLAAEAGRLLAHRATPGQLEQLQDLAARSGSRHAVLDCMVEMAGNRTLQHYYRQVVDRLHLPHHNGPSPAVAMDDASPRTSSLSQPFNQRQA